MGDEMHYRTGGEWMRVTASIGRIGMVHQALALLNSGLGQEQVPSQLRKRTSKGDKPVLSSSLRSVFVTIVSQRL